MLLNNIYSIVLAVLLSGSFSGYFFYGAGKDSATVKYERLISSSEIKARDRLAVRESELIELSKLRVAAAIANEQKRKPARQEVVKYVYENTPDAGCAIDSTGMQLIANYIEHSF